MWWGVRGGRGASESQRVRQTDRQTDRGGIFGSHDERGDSLMCALVTDDTATDKHCVHGKTEQGRRGGGGGGERRKRARA